MQSDVTTIFTSGLLALPFSTTLLPSPSLDVVLEGNGHSTGSDKPVSLDLEHVRGIELSGGREGGGGVEVEEGVNVSVITIMDGDYRDSRGTIVGSVGAADDSDSEGEDDLTAPVSAVTTDTSSSKIEEKKNHNTSDYAERDNMNAVCPPPASATTQVPSVVQAASSSSHASAAVPVEEEVTAAHTDEGDESQPSVDHPCPGTTSATSAGGGGGGGGGIDVIQGLSRKRNRAAVKDK